MSRYYLHDSNPWRAEEMPEIYEHVAESATTTDCISRADIEYHTQLEARGNGQYEEVEVAYKSDIDNLPPITPTEQQNKEKEHDGKSICHTCATNNCPFQSGIYRSNCDFYTSVNKGRR